MTIYDASLYPNTTVAFPLTDLPRTTVDESDDEFWWFGDLANGSQIVPGSYVYALMPSPQTRLTLAYTDCSA